MRISDIETIPVRFRRDTTDSFYDPDTDTGSDSPYHRGAPDWPVYSVHDEALFVRIETEEGLTGWGEALAPVAPQVPARIIDLLLREVLLGRDPRETDSLYQEMYDTMRVRGNIGFMHDAIAACDIALWDLKGKAANEPIWRLLGGKHREEIPVYVSGVPGSSIEEKIDVAKEYVDHGYTAFKSFKREGVAEVEALRETFGDEVTLLFDGYWDYTLEEGIAVGDRLREAGVEFFECPFKPEFVDAHRELRERTGVPVALGEAERTRYQFRELCERGAIDIVQADMGRVGITEYRAIADVARAFDRRIAPHRSTVLGVCSAASLHLCAAVPNLYLLEARPSLPDRPHHRFELLNRVLKEPLACTAGSFAVPTKPGLGVEPDYDVLDEARI